MRCLPIVLWAVLVLWPSGLQAGRYPASGAQAFSYPDNTTNLGDGTEISSNDGIATVVSGALRLTDRSRQNTYSAFKLPDLDPGLVLSSWEVTASVRMDRVTSPWPQTPADGWSLNIGPIPGGYGEGEGGFAMAGGLVIAFDTYNNGNDPPSIEIFANGISVANFPQTFQFSTQTYRPLTVRWDQDGLDVIYTVNTTPVAICTNLPVPGYRPAAGHRFAFSARTGGSTQGTRLDNLTVTTAAVAPLETGGPVIAEFCAENGGSLEDENGDESDWIEIYNGQAAPANMAGWLLSDSATTPGKWMFPAVTIPAYGYLTVFASSKNRTDPASQLHTNFRIGKEGGYLALRRADGTVASEFNYGTQVADVTFGLLPGESGYTYGYLETATPGKANTGLQAAGPPAEEVVFLRDGQPVSGGLVVTGFDLAVQPPAAPDSVVRYTLDNTVPSATSPVFPVSVPVNATTTVRARVFTPDCLPGPVSSRTFLQLDSSLTNYNGSGKPFSSTLPIIV
ncbi:MAG: lamin tail domain-containing protein, partial [Akkermansiaceae bacterium]|nr:lamin tail domain-containing protein [Akkermansiaceae bacterium]